MRGKAAACKRAALAVTGGSAPFRRALFHRSFRCSTHPFHIFYLPFFVKIRYKERGFIMGKAGLWFKRLWKRLRSFRFTKSVCSWCRPSWRLRHWASASGASCALPAGAARNGRRGAHHPAGKTTLSESITVTGTVESGSVANVTTSLSYPVKEIFVQVGDTVSEGDVICTLDSSDLEEQLAKRQEALAESRETAQKKLR